MPIQPKRDNALVLAIAMVVGLVFPVLQQAFQELRYASLSEKRVAHEIVSAPEDVFDNISVVESADVPKLVIEYFIPLEGDVRALLQDIEHARAGAAVADIGEHVSRMIDRTKSVNSLTQSPTFAELAEQLHLIVLADLKQSADRLALSTLSPAQRDLELVNLGDNTSALQALIYDITKRLLTRYANHKPLLALHSQMRGYMKRLRVSRLLDLETPYFSLPPHVAEDKEREILRHLKSDSRDIVPLLALVSLYAEMRNLHDAVYIYRQFVEPRHVSPDMEPLRNMVRERLRHYLDEMPEADIVSAHVHISDNLSAEVQEIYEIARSGAGRRIVVQLPFKPDDIRFHSMVDETGGTIRPVAIRPSWKGSTIVELPARVQLSRVIIKYSTRSIAQYDSSIDKTVFRYGGLASNRSVACELTLPFSLRIVALEQQPELFNHDQDVTRLRWVDPKLPFKFAALHAQTARIGMAGELINVRTIYGRTAVAIGLVVAFLFATSLLQRRIPNEILRDFSYAALAVITTLGVIDLRRLTIVASHVILGRLSAKTILVITALLLFALMHYIPRQYPGSRFVSLLKCAYEIALAVVVTRVLLQMIDLGDTFRSMILLGGISYFVLHLLRVLANELKLSATRVVVIAAVIGAGSYYAWDYASMVQVSRATYVWIGVTIGLVLLIGIGVFYVAYRRELINVPDSAKSPIDLVMESISTYLHNISVDGAKLLLVMLIVTSFYLESAVLALLGALVAAVAEPWLARHLVNRKPQAPINPEPAT